MNMADGERDKQTSGNGIGKGKPGPGRPKGSPNKTTALLKDAILLAAQKAGGEEGLVGYLEKQAIENPGPFMTLLGKVLPLHVQTESEETTRVPDRDSLGNVDRISGLAKYRRHALGGLVARWPKEH